MIDNRPGAGGTLGSGEVMRAAPDGHTLLMATSSTHSIAPHLNPNLPYKPELDFTPVAEVATAPNIVLVPKDLPVASMKELIAYAKARPGQLNYATSGNGTIVHLTTEAFKAQAGLSSCTYRTAVRRSRFPTSSAARSNCSSTAWSAACRT